MEAFLIEHRLYGFVVGAFTFLIIGLFHPLVIKAEYHIGVKSVWLFLLTGIICVVLSFFINSTFISMALGVTAFSSFWSIFEIYEQKKRVEKGWFPANPKKKSDYKNPFRKDQYNQIK